MTASDYLTRPKEGCHMSKDKSDKNWFAKHKILTVIGVLVLLAIIGGATSSSKNTGSTASTTSANSSSGSSNKASSSTATKASTLPGLNQPADDGSSNSRLL